MFDSILNGAKIGPIKIAVPKNIIILNKENDPKISGFNNVAIRRGIKNVRISPIILIPMKLKNVLLCFSPFLILVIMLPF